MSSSKTTGRFIAFLRGLNVGGHTVKMERLRHLFAEMGYDEVGTYIASGNVVFAASSGDPAEHEQMIASHLEATLGYTVAAFVRAGEELLRVASFEAFSETERSAGLHGTYVVFLPAPPAPEVMRRVADASTETDLFRFDGRELYWLCRTRFSDSPFAGPALEKLLGTAATVRNTTTVTKIASRYFGATA